MLSFFQLIKLKKISSSHSASSAWMDDDVEYPAVDDAGVEYLEYPNYGEMAWPGMANMFGGFFVPGPDFATSIQPVVMRSRQTNELVPPPKHLLKPLACAGAGGVQSWCPSV